jgi:phosphoglycolate phosphatase-like HAD superfamily hydrolase
MRLAGAIFDLDGTIADTIPICYVTFRHTVEQFGGPSLSDAEIRGPFGPSEDGMFEQALPTCWQQAFAAYLGVYERHLPRCAVFPGIAAALGWLREQRVPVALVTGKSRPTTLLSLKQFALDGAFEVIETGSPKGIVKGAAIARVVAGWRVPPPDVLYIGDTEADIRAAHEAGVLPIAAAWAPSAIAAELEAKRPHALFTEAGAFHAWLIERGAS